jgi:signal transduction histidine kinase
MLDDEMYFPVLSSVVEKNKVLGYVVNWKHLYAKQESVDQFGQLLGSNGKLYFGNDDGLFWTDLRKAIPKPPVDLSQLQNVTIYSREKGNPLLGSVRKIANSRWLILVELSSSSFQRTANSFLQRVTIIGILLILAGSLWAWLISRRITKPLQQLGSAASAIADGNYSLLVHINRNDELGTLAKSFNIMAVRVRAAQESMEQKVEETSKELLTAITDIQDQKESEKKKDEFISIASHELKTPLTTIKAFFQLAAKEMPADSRPFQLIGKASRQLSRMERLIGDLLDVSKINAGKMYYNLEEFDFREILKEATDSVQEIYPDHNLIVEKTVPVRLLADRHRVEQVIVNLLTNAVKYSPGKDQVVIRSELEGSMLLVSIQDFGIGIEEKHLSELFGRFYRVNTDHRFQGLGLGLFISAEIIKRHGGDISVKSELGKGSIFAFRIPVAIAT